MIFIDQLNIAMPAGFEPRAMSITWYVGAALAKQNLDKKIEDCEVLCLPTVTLCLGQSDASIGEDIAQSIVLALKKERSRDAT